MHHSLVLLLLLLLHARRAETSPEHLCREWSETRWPTWPSKGFEGTPDPLDIEALRSKSWYFRGDTRRLDAFLHRLAAATPDQEGVRSSSSRGAKGAKKGRIGVVIFGGR